MKKLLTNSRGFSLIELMVVVAIIAILASFALPQYRSFQSKARQKEGLTLLNSFYVAAKATEAEQGIFAGNLVGTGFNPAGRLHYRVSAAAGGLTLAEVQANGWTGAYNATCINTINNCASYGDWNEITAGSFSAQATNNCTPAANSLNGTFLTCVSAAIQGNAGTDVDTWSVNQLKEVVLRNDGAD